MSTPYHQISKITARIAGVLTTTSLVRQASPDDSAMSYKIPVVTDTGMVYVPIVTANSVRGLIRRCAADVLYAEMQRQGIMVSKELYLSMCRGAFGRTQIDSSGGTTEQAINAAQHLLGGVFGGGQMMWSSRMTVADLVPITMQTLRVMPADLHPYAIEIEPFKLSTKTLMAPRDDFENIPKHLVVENLQEAYTDHQVTKAAQRAASKDGATTKDDLNGFSLNEAMVPGVPLSFNLLLKDATPAQLGLVLQALLSWCNNEALGGGRARGYGSFNPTQLTLQTKKGEEKGERIPLFTGNQPFVEFANRDAVAPYLEAMQEALPESVNPAILSQVFPTTVESKAGAAKESSSKGKK